MIKKKKHLCNLMIIMMILISIISLNSVNGLIQTNDNYSFSKKDGFIDISVQEAWEMLNDTSNGIQYPIDVRTDEEWINAHIDTPYPENPKHHNFYEWEDQEVLDDFLLKYQGKEIIVYCRSGSRSITASNILIDNNFNGVIYNMLGGITAWRSAGLPTVPNRQPENPSVNGTSTGQINQNIGFTINSIDPDEDIVYYLINWSDGSDQILIGPYNSGENVNINHNWEETGLYPIQIKAIDKYGYESNWTTYEFSISQTELEIINIAGGFGGVTIDIKNIGDFIADEVSSIISIVGGLFERINLTHSCSGCSECGNKLDRGMIKKESTRESGFIIGFGNIKINVLIWAKNAEEVNAKLNGFIFGSLIIL